MCHQEEENIAFKTSSSVNNLLKNVCLTAKGNTFLIYVRSRALSEVTPPCTIVYNS